MSAPSRGAAVTGLGEPVSRAGLLAAAVAVSAWGVSGVVAKSIDMGGVAIGAYRFSLYGLVVGALLAMRGDRPTLGTMRASFWGGLALGLDVAFFFSAVKLTTVANATVIGALQPIVVALIASRFFGERLDRRDIALGAFALAGVGVVVFGASGAAEWSLTGDLLAVGALFSWSGYFLASKLAKDRISTNQFTVGAALWTGLFNIPIALAFGQDLGWPDARSWLGLIVLTFGAGILGHALMNWAIQEIPLWLSSVLTLLIPVVSAATAWVALGEALRPIQIAAMVAVLAALAAIVGRQSGIGTRPRPLRR